MNELMSFKSITGKKQWLLTPAKQKKSSYTYNLYNEIKQDWSTKVRQTAVKQGFKKVEACHFNYLVIEHNKKRDPSNVFASATKFIEDGLQAAGVIENDGWDQVLGIRSYVHLDRESTGAVMLVMSNEPLCYNAMLSYYQTRSECVNSLGK